MASKPWERRLKDLSQLLGNCSRTYFDPELFRMNANQFLQTARTITFIIQKHKATIPSFNDWYEKSVLSKWRDDPVMTWAKESRNKIEKEGDLDLHSTLEVALILGYLEETDIKIECSSRDILNANLKRLRRFALKKLPTAATEGAVIRIERSWVSSSIPDWELLKALNRVYLCIYECCENLAEHIGLPINEEIPLPGDTQTWRDVSRHVAYLKLNKLNFHFVGAHRIPKIDRDLIPQEWKDEASKLRSIGAQPPNLESMFKLYSEIARLYLRRSGEHDPMLVLFSSDWKPVFSTITQFEDRADKYIFWRVMADRVALFDAHALICIGEAWMREGDRLGLDPISNLRIGGECLLIFALDRSGNLINEQWRILRNNSGGVDSLDLMKSDPKETKTDSTPFLVPVMRAMGLSVSVGTSGVKMPRG